MRNLKGYYMTKDVNDARTLQLLERPKKKEAEITDEEYLEMFLDSK